MPKEYVYMGATLSCKFGSADSKLMMTPQHRVQQGGKFKANIGDAKPFVNILPFGMCKSPTNPTVAAATAAAGGALQQMPCTPVCTVWMGGMPNTLIDKMPALMNKDKLLCTFGAGMIEIKDSGQGAPSKGAGGAAGGASSGGDSGEGKAKEAEKSKKVPPELPEFDGKNTEGVLVTSDGKQIPFSSGGGNPPAYPQYGQQSATHVEGKAALYMRENGIAEGTVYHNNTNGTCGFCDRQVPALLPEGAKLTVVPPANAVANNPRAVDVAKTYIGNSTIPKIR